MKTIYFVFTLCMLSCSDSIGARMSPQSNVPTPTPPNQVASKDDRPSFVVDKFTLRLAGKDGRCILQYRLTDSGGQWAEGDLGMEAPCDFIGRKIKKDPPQKYVFNQGAKRVTVLLVTGGSPHPTFKDEFMANGCGTRLAKVRVYSDRVDTERASSREGLPNSEPDVFCPSEPLDDVFFATG